MKDKKIFNILGVYRKVQVLRWGGGGTGKKEGGGDVFGGMGERVPNAHCNT